MRQQGLTVETIRIQDTLSQLSDSSYLSPVWGIDADDKYLYIGDYQNARIVVVDTQFRLVRTIGKSGSGPGEFKGARFPKVFQNHIYAHSGFGGRINVFSKSGEFIRTIIPDVQVPIVPSFSLNDSGQILLSTHDYPKPIALLSENGKLIKVFGEFLPDYDGKIVPAHNHRFVIPIRNGVLALCASMSFIEKYDREGNLLLRRDLSEDYEPIKERCQEIENEYRKVDLQQRMYSSFQVFSDAVLYDNFLYAVFICPISHNSGREILVIDSEDLKIKKVIRLLPSGASFRGLAKLGNIIFLDTDEIYKAYCAK